MGKTSAHGRSPICRKMKGARQRKLTGAGTFDLPDTIEAANPRELVMKWSLFLATAERGVYFATYRGSFIAPEAALESDAGALAP